MSNVLSDEKKQQVLALGRLGWTLRQIEEATGVRRETASGYLRRAGMTVRAPGRWGRPPNPAKEVITDSASAAEAKPANEVITDSTVASPSVGTSDGAKPAKEVITDPRPQRSPAASACEPYRELIEEALGRGRNAMAIYQELVDAHGFRGAYPSVMRFVRKLRGARPVEAHPRIHTEPGVEAQVDYGEGPMVRDAQTGKYRRTRLFVLTLGYSRKAVRLLVWRSSSRTWAELHEEAFRRLGGAPRTVVLDNLREGVLRADVYEPTLNPLFAAVLAHYGAIALPCRVRHPDRKGKVESSVGHTQRTALKGLRFESLDEAQTYLDRWDAQWADTRIHGTTKRQVAVMFADEKPHLRPLPVEPFRYFQFGTRTVHLDGHVEIEGAYYQAPPGLIGVQLPVQWDGRHVRLIDPRTGQLLREHRRAEPGGFRSTDEDRPARTPQTTLQLLSRATRAGRHVGALCHAIHKTDGEVGVRRILGVLALVKHHGAVETDFACAAALDVGVPSYRFVRRYLEHHRGPHLVLRQVDPLLRELTEYRDLIRRMTKETP